MHQSLDNSTHDQERTNYTGPAPGDSFDVEVPDALTYFTGSTIKLIILDILPLIVAIFTVFMFMFVCYNGLGMLWKSFYIFHFSPFIRKKIKFFKRIFRNRATDANSSSSSEPEQTETQQEEGKLKVKDQPSKKLKDASKRRTASASAASLMSSKSKKSRDRQRYSQVPEGVVQKILHAAHLSRTPSRNSNMSRISAASSHSSDMDWPHGLGESRSITWAIPESKPKTKSKIIPIRFRVTNKIMPDEYKHLRRSSPGPAQKAFAASPDVQAYDHERDVYRSPSKLSRQIAKINQRRKLKEMQLAHKGIAIASLGRPSIPANVDHF